MRVKQIVGRLVMVLAVVVMTSCSSGDQTSSTSGQGKNKVGDPQPRVLIDKKDIPTDVECETFAQTYAKAVMGGDVDGVNQLIDWDKMLQYVTENVDTVKGFRDGFISGAKRSINQSGLGSQLIDAVKGGGTLSLLRVHDADGQKRALIRILLPDAGVNYHDMVLARDAGGKVRAVDIYIFLSAETMTQTLRRLYVMAAAGQSRSILDKLVGAESDFVKHADKFQKMSQQFQQGAHQEVLNIYNGLPKTMQQEKSVMLIRMQAAMSVDDATYAKAIEEFRTIHPKDPCLDMVSIDYYIVRQDFAEALASVDRLDKAVGGDPYLDVIRSGIYIETKELAKAHALCEATIAKTPELIELYWTLINVTMLEKKFDETAKWLTRIGEQFALEFDDLTTLPEYADFVKSPEYLTWLKSRNR